MSISYLIYTSYSKSLLTLDELGTLWEQAKRNNLKNNISGLLLYQEGIFMQMLEGNKTDISLLYEKIQQDSRHICEQKPIIGQIQQRFFPDWSMGFKHVEQGHNLPSLKVFLNYIDGLLYEYDKDKVSEILNFILGYSKWSLTDYQA